MDKDKRLTKLSKCSGCGAKVGAGTLSKLLDELKKQGRGYGEEGDISFKTHEDPNLVVGFDTNDDASVYILDKERALVQTVDFFPPIVDDPYLFGQIAAANAISDIYAMGAKPSLALNIMCISDEMDDDTVRKILLGGYDKAYEAGVIISGGHTIRGSEPYYGLSVTGFSHPDRILTNSGVKDGDVLILTKPLGIGILTTSVKADFISSELKKRIYQQMATLNKYSAGTASGFPVSACTDITGFGLLGHLCEMAEGSSISLYIDSGKIPYHKEALEMAEMGLIPEGAYRNREFTEGKVVFENKVPVALEDIMYDPQTSGGLLFSVPESISEELLKQLNENEDGIPSSIIGYAKKEDDGIVHVY